MGIDEEITRTHGELSTSPRVGGKCDTEINEYVGEPSTSSRIGENSDRENEQCLGTVLMVGRGTPDSTPGRTRPSFRSSSLDRTPRGPVPPVPTATGVPVRATPGGTPTMFTEDQVRFMMQNGMMSRSNVEDSSPTLKINQYYTISTQMRVLELVPIQEISTEIP